MELRTPLEDGWGIATDGSSLIVSDSSSTLYWLDPKTLAEQRRVVVRDGEQEVPWVNEVTPQTSVSDYEPTMSASLIAIFRYAHGAHKY